MRYRRAIGEEACAHDTKVFDFLLDRYACAIGELSVSHGTHAQLARSFGSPAKNDCTFGVWGLHVPLSSHVVLHLTLGLIVVDGVDENMGKMVVRMDDVGGIQVGDHGILVGEELPPLTALAAWRSELKPA